MSSHGEERSQIRFECNTWHFLVLWESLGRSPEITRCASGPSSGLFCTLSFIFTMLAFVGREWWFSANPMNEKQGFSILNHMQIQ